MQKGSLPVDLRLLSSNRCAGFLTFLVSPGSNKIPLIKFHV